jgi:hypothetical protein
MVSLADLTNAIVDALRRIQPLVADLEPPVPASIIAYIDSNPVRQNLESAKYSMAPGTVVVAAVESIQTEGEMARWLHRVEFYVRPQKGQTTFKIIDDIMRGVPDPGDGQRWYFCPVMAGVDPTSVMLLTRVSDPEQIDYWTIQTETKETGDA